MPVKVCVGGTFNALHEGHRVLLSRAFSEGDEVYVGLTSDAMASRNRKVPVKAYDIRLSALTELLAEISRGKPFQVFPIVDEFGPAAEGDFDVIVASEETRPNAERINKRRREKGLKPLRIVSIGMVLAPDGKPFSSTRIIAGEDNA